MTVTTSFKEGDRIVFDSYAEEDGVDLQGMTGTIIKIREKSYSLRQPIGIRFDNYSRRFHGLSNLCLNGYGWWVSLDTIRKATLLSEREPYHDVIRVIKKIKSKREELGYAF